MSILVEAMTPEGVCFATDSRTSVAQHITDDAKKIERCDNGMLVSMIGDVAVIQRGRRMSQIVSWESLGTLVSRYLDNPDRHVSAPSDEKVSKMIQGCAAYLHQMFDPVQSAIQIFLNYINEYRKQNESSDLPGSNDVESIRFIRSPMEERYARPFVRVETNEFEEKAWFTFPRSVVGTLRNARSDYSVVLAGDPTIAIAGFDEGDTFPTIGAIEFPFELRVRRPLDPVASTRLHLRGAVAECILLINELGAADSTLQDRILRAIDELTISADQKDVLVRFLKEKFTTQIPDWQMRDIPLFLRTLLELSIIVSEVPFLSNLASMQSLHEHLAQKKFAFSAGSRAFSPIGGGVQIGVLKKFNTSSVENHPPIFKSSHSASPTLPSHTGTQ